MDELEDNYENIFIIGSLRNLKILKVILQWSPLIEDDTTTELTELMKCLFDHVKYLEKLVLVAENSDCSKVIQSLLALPRVSNSTAVVSLESVAGVDLPQDLCSSSSIIKLKCNYCIIPEDCILNWTSLKSLTISFISLSDEQMEQITSNCQQLESLKLTEFCGFHHLHLTSSKCKRLELIEYRYSPNCTSKLIIQVVFDGVKIMLSDLSSLVHADLPYNLYNFYESDEVIGKSMVKDHLTSVACANELIIPSLYIEKISVLVLQNEDVSLPLLECKQLTINARINNYTFLGIDRLLSSTPCLENLTIHLKGWSPLTFDTTTEQTELMKYLLEHAKNLEKLAIV
ncbi:hypothetical protein H5410_001592 [Solanum commersonii]|uniref:F-box/LRR-repeat protein 15/At3g58940/PEG3-like LRR domain-containing protein n=1 Tax=Solanum commersonii TaxID=4109 RepID=A0A9J6B033_SOLCO|nr:hypothetical protein H5410_001592 [Solanum commersonii]